MRIAITGATGYIGSALVECAQKQGLEVFSLSRRQGDFEEASWCPYDLDSDQEPVLPFDVQAVIHLATAGQLESESQVSRELRAAELLLQASHRRGARFVFVSSQTARSDAPTFYGRSKWIIESKVLAAGATVIRPGLVYGGAESGLFGLLASVVRRVPVLPAFVPAPLVQPIHVGELCQGLLRAALEPAVEARAYNIAAAAPVSFTHFMDALAEFKCGRRGRFVPVPVALVRMTAMLLGDKLSLRLGVGRLLSLFDQPRIASAADLNALGIVTVSMRRGMRQGTLLSTASPDRRPALREAFILFSYLLKQRGLPLSARRYVRALEALNDGKALHWPSVFYRLPWFVGFLEQGQFRKTAIGIEVDSRLRAATLIAEASRFGATRFMGERLSGTRRLHNAISLLQVVGGEILMRVMDKVIGRSLKNKLAARNLPT